MKINQVEISSYLLITVLTVILLSMNVLTFDTPNTREPTNPNLPDLETTPLQGNTRDPSQGPQSNSSVAGLINILFYILIGVVLFLIIRGLVYMRGSSNRINRRGVDAQTQIRSNLEDARLRAYEIIDHGLQTGEYRSSFIDAYIALDLALDNFREIKRPKHITPKEYAYSVSMPVFKPSVFKFVSVFYELRYGGRNATQEQLQDFRRQLDFLFSEEIPEGVRKQWQEEFDHIVKTDYTYTVPRIIDPTRPGGN